MPVYIKNFSKIFKDAIFLDVFDLNYAKSSETMNYHIVLQNNPQMIKVGYFTRIIFNAIYTKHFAKILLKLLDNDIIGTINLASSNFMSKYSFLKYLKCCYLGNSNRIESSISEKNNFNIKRPENTTLNNSKLSTIATIPTVEEGIDELVKDYVEELK